jgi:hypothetical protein
MKPKPTFLLVCLCITIHSFGQQPNPSVIASAGGISQSNAVNLEWTLGESFVQSISSSSKIYTQVFHQPILRAIPANFWKGNVVNNISINVFPNPASSILNIYVTKASETSSTVSLIDVNGKMLLTQPLPARASFLKLDVSKFSQGTYFLQLINNTGSIEAEYKIIKAGIL